MKNIFFFFSYDLKSLRDPVRLSGSTSPGTAHNANFDFRVKKTVLAMSLSKNLKTYNNFSKFL